MDVSTQTPAEDEILYSEKNSARPDVRSDGFFIFRACTQPAEDRQTV